MVISFEIRKNDDDGTYRIESDRGLHFTRADISDVVGVIVERLFEEQDPKRAEGEE